MTPAFRWLEGKLEPVEWTLPDVREAMSVPFNIRPLDPWNARERRRRARRGCRGRRGARRVPPPTMAIRFEPPHIRTWRSHVLNKSYSAIHGTWHVDVLLYLPPGEQPTRDQERAIERVLLESR